MYLFAFYLLSLESMLLCFQHWESTQTSPFFAGTTARLRLLSQGTAATSLATECGISVDQLQQYNPDHKFCPILRPGQLVCCSPGSLPGIRPKPLDNGTCASYMVEPNESCATIAAENGLSATDIDEFNKVITWGFDSCGHGLPIGLRICLSIGNAPMPAPINGSICGPTVPGLLTHIISYFEGQCDMGNKWADSGCPAGNCLRSHGKTTDPFENTASRFVPVTLTKLLCSKYHRNGAGSLYE